MFFKFCSDYVLKVNHAVCPALANIIEKFDDDQQKQATIVKVIKNKFMKAKTYKKR